ncbi:MAG: hydrogenase maturation nickel metallochaperone HypA [Lachnospiraceae bacterium]|jgi:hydrogenase nickel incorporation protein HypA/HybF|nr:hydrogenase maturation nickel metallochaperone HypA [Lachnospiraceae bacterium]
MHELSIVKRFMNIALEEAEKRKIDRITALTLQVGEMTDVLPEYLHKYYDMCAEGTVLEGSKLIIEPVPMKVKCLSCGHEYNPMKTKDRVCDACGSGECKLLEGRDITVKALSYESL